jgi:hypothetical protein
LFPRNSYLNKFFAEKRIPEKDFEVTDRQGITHTIPNGVVVEFIASMPKAEQDKAADVIRKIDFQNGDVNHFLKHMAGMVAEMYEGALRFASVDKEAKDPPLWNAAEADEAMGEAYRKLTDLKLGFDSWEEIPKSAQPLYKAVMDAMDAVGKARKETYQVRMMVQRKRFAAHGKKGGALYGFSIDFDLAQDGQWYARVVEFDGDYDEIPGEWGHVGPFGSKQEVETFVKRERWARPVLETSYDLRGRAIPTPRDPMSVGEFRREMQETRQEMQEWERERRNMRLAFNKEDPDELLGQLVKILKREGLVDEASRVKGLQPTIQKAWRNRER